MSRSSIAGTTDYSHQSLDDMLTDLDDWIIGLTNTQVIIQTNVQQLQEHAYSVNAEMEDLIAYASKFYDTSIKEITEIRQELQVEIQPNHISRLSRLAVTARNLNRTFGRVWHRDYKPKDYGDPRFLIVERIYSHGRDMVVDMIDLGNLAARLADFVGKRNNQSVDLENTPPTIFMIDNSQHINQHGGVRVHSEGDTNIGGDVTGRDKVSSE